MKYYRAFTLIELLVVIAIIGVLASIVTVSLSSANKRALDTQVKSAVRQYKTLMDLEVTEKGHAQRLYTGEDPGTGDWLPLEQPCNLIDSYTLPASQSTNLSKAIELCEQIIEANPSITWNFWVGPSTISTNVYRVIGRLASNSATYFCINGAGQITQTTNSTLVGACL